MISNDYNCAFENNFAFPSKSNISRDCQMIKLQNIRRISNSPKEIIDLEINVLKVMSEFSKFIFNEFYNGSFFLLYLKEEIRGPAPVMIYIWSNMTFIIKVCNFQRVFFKTWDEKFANMCTSVWRICNLKFYLHL